MKILNIAMCCLSGIMLISCAPKNTKSDAENPSATDPFENIVTKSVPAEVEFAQSTGLKSILDQIHYVSPFTEADVLTETAVVIEGETGEAVIFEKVAECYSGFPEENPERAVTSAALSKFIKGYYKAKEYSDDAVSKIAAEAVSTFGKCEAATVKTCPGRCINYIAAKTVATSLEVKPEITLPDAADFLEETDIEDGVPNDDG